MILINNLSYPQQQLQGPNPYYYQLSRVVKCFPTFTKQTEYAKPRTIYLKQEYPDNEFFTNTSTPNRTHSSSDNSTRASVSRAKTTIRDLVLCNHFNQFITFTFNGGTLGQKKYGYTIHDRENVDELKSVMAKWLNNQQMIHGKFDYLIIPEFHKDGKSIHFHALFRDYPGHLRDSGRYIHGRKAYNITSYKAGHSTLVNIDPGTENSYKVANYITKYMTKDMPIFNNKKRFWSSKSLIRPTKVPNAQLRKNDYATFTDHYHIPDYGLTLSQSGLVLDPSSIKKLGSK